MSLSSKLFLLSADDSLHALSNAAFMRMLRRESIARVPEFAGQRVRQASIVVELLNGVPTQIVRCTFALLDIDEHGVLDLDRWNAQQIARVDDPLAPDRPDRGSSPQVVDASSRFIARGGSWQPNRALLHRIEQAAMQKQSCHSGTSGSLTDPAAKQFATKLSSESLQTTQYSCPDSSDPCE